MFLNDTNYILDYTFTLFLSFSIRKWLNVITSVSISSYTSPLYEIRFVFSPSVHIFSCTIVTAV